MRSGREHKLFRRVRIALLALLFGFFADVIEHRVDLYVSLRQSTSNAKA